MLPENSDHPMEADVVAWPCRSFSPFLLASAIVPGMAAGQEQQLKKIHVNGVELHYVDRGHGEPVIFIHGGLADYRMWDAQTAAFARTIVRLPTAGATTSPTPTDTCGPITRGASMRRTSPR